MGLLRLLLAIAVLENHLAVKSSHPETYGLGLVYGDQAVQIFFIVSGFYMALVLHEKYNRPGDYFNFIQQRFLRLYPAYLVVLALSVGIYSATFAMTSRAMGAVTFYQQYDHVQNAFTYALYGFCNLTGVGQDWISFFRQDVTTGQFYFGVPPPGTVSIWCPAFLFNPPAWSLLIEFTFYLLAPFLVRCSIGAQAGWLIASVALRYALLLSGAQPIHTWLTFFFPSELGFFLAGSMAWRFYRQYQDRLAGFASRWWVALLFGAVLLGYRRLPGAHDFDVVLIPLCAAMVPVLFAFTRNNRIDRMIGELSYPFYLFHWNVIIIAGAIMGSESSSIFEPVCIAATLASAFLIYWLFECRMDAWRERLFRQKRAGV